MKIPKVVQHEFAFSFDLTQAALDQRRVFKCKFCGAWTDRLTDAPDDDAQVNGVCRGRERRRGARRAGVRASGRRIEDMNVNRLALRQAEALGAVTL